MENADPNTAREVIRNLITLIGDDPNREGLKETPRRVFDSWAELFSGYGVQPDEISDLFTVFDEKYGSLVLLKDIEFYSTCEHHLLPFYGKAHVAYIPNGKVVGISKLARILEVYSRRLQVQERIGEQVVRALDEHLGTKGAACVIEARHLCMCARGIQKQNSVMVTSSLTGEFDRAEVRAELMNLIRG
jgi:GTP cyclohydrolase I